MSETNRRAVAVNEVNMAEVAPDGAQRVGDGNLLDIHVKEVSQKFHIAAVERLQKRGGVAHAIEDVGFIAIQRLEQERLAVLRGLRG